ncbi:hypothetical protein GCM10027612_15920 [Microbispora bryophytorum subsp. camponoti]
MVDRAPLLAISILAGTVTFVLAPTRYEADTSLVLATPVNGGVYSRDPNRPLPRGNPLLQFNDALKTAASIVIQSMNTQDVWTQLGAPKDGPTTITIDDGRSNPGFWTSAGRTSTSASWRRPRRSPPAF